MTETQPDPDHARTVAHELVQRIANECGTTWVRRKRPPTAERELAAASEEVRSHVVREMLARSPELRSRAAMSRHGSERNTLLRTEAEFHRRIHEAASSDTFWTQDDVPALIEWSELEATSGWRQNVALRCFENVGALGDPRVRAWLERCVDRERASEGPWWSWIRRVEAILGREARLELDDGRAWTAAVGADLAAMDAPSRATWTRLLLDAEQLRGRGPTDASARRARRWIEAVGRDDAVQRFERWLSLAGGPRAADSSAGVPANQWSSSDELLVGMCGFTRFLADERVVDALGRLVLASPSSGRASEHAERIACAAASALGEIPGTASRALVRELAASSLPPRVRAALERVSRNARPRDGGAMP